MVNGLISEFKNIRKLPSGYQVSVVRGGTEFSRHFAGHSKASLKLASEYRDILLETLPSKRRQDVPARVLKAAGMTRSVVGVHRNERRRYYSVGFRDPKSGKFRMKSFTWNAASEEPRAYQAAVKFRRQLLGGRKKK